MSEISHSEAVANYINQYKADRVKKGEVSVGEAADITDSERKQATGQYAESQGLKPETELHPDSDNYTLNIEQTHIIETGDGVLFNSNIGEINQRDWDRLSDAVKSRGGWETGVNTYKECPGWVVRKPETVKGAKRNYEKSGGGKMHVAEALDPKLATATIFYSGKDSGVKARYAFRNSREEYVNKKYATESGEPKKVLFDRLDRFLDVAYKNYDRNNGFFNKDAVREHIKGDYDFEIVQKNAGGRTTTYLEIFHADRDRFGTGKVVIELSGVNNSGRPATNVENISLVFDKKGKQKTELVEGDYSIVASLLTPDEQEAKSVASAPGGEATPPPKDEEGDGKEPDLGAEAEQSKEFRSQLEVLSAGLEMQAQLQKTIRTVLEQLTGNTIEPQPVEQALTSIRDLLESGKEITQEEMLTLAPLLANLVGMEMPRIEAEDGAVDTVQSNLHNGIDNLGSSVAGVDSGVRQGAQNAAENTKDLADNNETNSEIVRRERAVKGLEAAIASGKYEDKKKALIDIRDGIANGGGDLARVESTLNRLGINLETEQNRKQRILELATRAIQQEGLSRGREGQLNNIIRRMENADYNPSLEELDQLEQVVS